MVGWMVSMTASEVIQHRNYKFIKMIGKKDKRKQGDETLARHSEWLKIETKRVVHLGQLFRDIK